LYTVSYYRVNAKFWVQQLTDCAIGGSHSVPWEAFEMAALRYLAMRDPDLPKIPGVRELAGLTYG
jgi:hypothetical protein